MRAQGQKALALRRTGLILNVSLAAVALSCLLPFCYRAGAQGGPRLRTIAAVQTSEDNEGTRVTLVADSPLNDYMAYRRGETFYLVIPHANGSLIQQAIRGRSFSDALMSNRETDLIFSFELKAGVAARVNQRFNRLEIIFTLTPQTENTISSARPVGVETTAQPSPNFVGARVANIPKVTRAPKLEDYLQNRPREREAVITDFRQRSPGDGVPASLQTTAYLSYDDSKLYVTFVCKDDPSKVRAHLAKREEILEDDLVSVTLDTFHDKRRAYTFSVNPLGVQLDGIFTEGQGDDYSFDTLWHSEGKVLADGYIVSLAIPFKSLRFSNSDVQSWGIALGRSITRNSEECYWPYITERVQGFVQQLGTLDGLRSISPGRNIQLNPYGLISKGRTLDTPPVGTPFYSRTGETRAGIDAKVVLKDALTLDLTVNPDFSQVESDEPQVLVNRRFEVFFPEKRPFFIENAGYFQTPENLFFSRRIANPQLGARLTGKLGRWALAGLFIDDRAPGKLMPEDDPLFNRRALVGVGRVQREFGEQSSAGFLFTSYDFGQSSNQVFSADTRLKLNQNWTFTGQLSQSNTRELDGTRLSGPAFYADLSRSSRHFHYSGTYTDRSPSFRSNLGFIPRVDIRELSQYASYSWQPNKYGIVSFGPSLFGLANWDRRGRLQDWSLNGDFSIEFKGPTSFTVGHSDAYTLFLDQGFRTDNTSVFFYTGFLKWLILSGSYGRGTGINYFPGSSLQPFRAVSDGGSLNITFRPSTRLRFDQTYIYSRLGRSLDPLVLGSFGPATIYNNHIFRSKLNYQFTRELSLRAILDYNATLPNSSLISLERDKNLTADILLTYLLNPGTALYVGYTDAYNNFDLASPSSTFLLPRTGAPVTSTGRQFFVKVSYLLRY